MQNKFMMPYIVCTLSFCGDAQKLLLLYCKIFMLPFLAVEKIQVASSSCPTCMYCQDKWSKNRSNGTIKFLKECFALFSISAVLSFVKLII